MVLTDRSEVGFGFSTTPVATEPSRQLAELVVAEPTRQTVRISHSDQECFRFVESRDLTPQLLAHHPQEQETLAYIQRQLHRVMPLAEGIAISNGPARIALDPVKENAEAFHALAVGSIDMSGNTENTYLFGRTIYRLLQAAGMDVAGYVKYKGASPHREQSSPIRLSVPQGVEGSLVTRFLQEFAQNETGPQSVYGFVEKGFAWELIGGNPKANAEWELHNGLRFVELWRTVFHELPPTEIPLQVDKVGWMIQSGYRASPSEVLALRADVFPDEKDMLIIRFLHRTAKELAAKNISRTEVLQELVYLAAACQEMGSIELAHLYVDHNPPVEMKSHVPTFFRNQMAEFLLHPEEHREKLACIQQAYGHETIDQTLIELYKSMPSDILRMYYPADTSFIFPNCTTFTEFRQLTNQRYQKLLATIMSEEMKHLGKSAGLLNAIGVIVPEAFGGKDLMVGRLADFGWGTNGGDDITLPDATSPPPEIDALSEENYEFQMQLILGNIVELSELFGTSLSEAVTTFALACVEAMQQTIQAKERLPLSEEYRAQITLIVKRVQQFDQLFRRKHFQSSSK